MIWGIVMDTQLVLYKSRIESRNHFFYFFIPFLKKDLENHFFFFILFLEKDLENSWYHRI